MSHDPLQSWILHYHNGNKEEALSRIYQETFDLLYRYIFKYVGHRQTAEDLVSDTYVTFIDIIDRYDHSSRVTTFLIGIAHNKIRQHWQQHPKESNIDDLDIPDYSTQDKLLTPDEGNDRSNQLQPYLTKVMDQLSDRYQDILNLRFYECYSIAETAKRMGISEENVRVLQHRALKKAAEIANTMEITLT